LARLTAAASMALFDRVGVVRGDPFVSRGEAGKRGTRRCDKNAAKTRQAVKKRNAQKLGNGLRGQGDQMEQIFAF
jgi:hypothetical protein